MTKFKVRARSTLLRNDTGDCSVILATLVIYEYLPMYIYEIHIACGINKP